MISLLTAVSVGEVFAWVGYILVALLCLMFMIVVHEYGHFVVGRLLGFKVDQFSVGFGPAILKYTSKKTGVLFALRCVPLGGYCAFHGETDDDSLGDDSKNCYELVETKSKKYKRARYLENENFNSKAPWKRILVFIAGAFFNFMSAVFLITIFFMAYGDFVPKVNTVYQFNDTQIEQKFMEGDVITRVDGKSLYSLVDANDFAKKMMAVGDNVVVTVLRGGELVDITVRMSDYTYVNDKNESVTQEGFGIGNFTFERIKFGFFEAFGRAFIFIFKIIGVLFATLGGVITGALGVSESLGGTITAIGSIATLARGGFEMVMYGVCVLSATLAVMNLLPLPALDGSHVVFTTIEWIRGKPINRKVENMIHAVGLILLFSLTILLDILHFAG